MNAPSPHSAMLSIAASTALIVAACADLTRAESKEPTARTPLAPVLARCVEVNGNSTMAEDCSLGNFGLWGTPPIAALAVGALRTPNEKGRGEALIVSIPDGRVLSRTAGASDGENTGGKVLIAGDLDHDQQPDLVLVRSRACSHRSVLLEAISGASSKLLWTRDLDTPSSVLSPAASICDDIDGDGVPEILVAYPAAAGATGMAVMLSGANGVTLWKLPRPTDAAFTVECACVSADVDGDGIHDVLLAISTSRHVHIACVSARDGHELFTTKSFGTSSWFGRSIATLGDVNADGVCDFAVGAPGRTPEVYVHSGLDGKVLNVIKSDGFSMTAADHDDLFGASIAAITDEQGRPTNDLVIGAPRAGLFVGRVVLVSASTGRTIKSWDAPESAYHLGQSLQCVGDLDRDGIRDLAIGGAFDVPHEDARRAGLMFLSGRDLHVITGPILVGER